MKVAWTSFMVTGSHLMLTRKLISLAAQDYEIHSVLPLPVKDNIGWTIIAYKHAR